jgi:hypothetical protein
MSDAAPDPASDKSFRLMYRSRSRIPAEGRKTELGELFGAARSNNKRRDITGALLITDDWFVQVLEGEEEAVRGLFARIESDPRHDSVSLLDSQTVGARVFSRWAMAKVAAEGEPDIPLLARTDGIVAAAGRATTPEQEAVLDLMRDAARGDATAS